MAGPEERIEFVARKLLYSHELGFCLADRGLPLRLVKGSGRRLLLGSPIYASLVDA
jgi:hypothetical protein